jgi:hypothetical protein
MPDKEERISAGGLQAPASEYSLPVNFRRGFEVSISNAHT